MCGASAQSQVAGIKMLPGLWPPEAQSPVLEVVARIPHPVSTGPGLAIGRGQCSLLEAEAAPSLCCLPSTGLVRSARGPL